MASDLSPVATKIGVYDAEASGRSRYCGAQQSCGEINGSGVEIKLVERQSRQFELFYI